MRHSVLVAVLLCVSLPSSFPTAARQPTLLDASAPGFPFPDDPTRNPSEDWCIEQCAKEFQCSSTMGRAGAAAGGTAVALAGSAFRSATRRSLVGIGAALVGGILACPAVRFVGCAIGCSGAGGTPNAGDCIGADFCVAGDSCDDEPSYPDAFPIGTCYYLDDPLQPGVCCRPAVNFPY